MHARNRLPLRGVAHIDARAHDVCERAAERGHARGDLVERIDGLPVHVARADDLAGAMRRSRAADEDAVPDPDRAAIAAERLPDAAGVDPQAVRAALDRDRAVHRRKALEMVAEIPGGGEEGR